MRTAVELDPPSSRPGFVPAIYAFVQRLQDLDNRKACDAAEAGPFLNRQNAHQSSPSMILPVMASTLASTRRPSSRSTLTS